MARAQYFVVKHDGNGRYRLMVRIMGHIRRKLPQLKTQWKRRIKKGQTGMMRKYWCKAKIISFAPNGPTEMIHILRRDNPLDELILEHTINHE